MSNAPYLLKGARWGYRMGNGEVVDSMLLEGLTCAINGCHMGITAEEIVKRFDVSRADQDAFAAESQRRAEQAVSVRRVRPRDRRRRGAAAERARRCRSSRDEYPRAGTTAEKLAALKAGVREGRHGHGRQLVGHQRRRRGAGGRDRGEGAGARAASRWRASSWYCTTGVDPMIMGMGPVEAMRKAARARRTCRSTTSTSSS